jgi:serine/threonine protein kinase
MIDSHCPILGILLFYSIRWALSYARVVQEARIGRIGELSVTKLEASHVM